MKMTVALYLVGLCVAIAHAYPYGAPVELPGVCRDMFPTGHNATANTTRAPFAITFSRVDKSSVKVTIANTSDTYFEGFFIQARKSGVNDRAEGTFKLVPADDDLKLLDCFNGEENAVSQRQKAHYTSKTFQWEQADSFEGDINFVATIVHETEDFWVNVMSASLSVKPVSSGVRLSTNSVIAFMMAFAAAVTARKY